MQKRELSGFATADSGGQLIERLLSLTPASAIGGSGAEQLFAFADALAADRLVYAQPATAAQTAGVLTSPGRVTSATSISIQFISQTSVASASTPLAGFYAVGIYRR